MLGLVSDPLGWLRGLLYMLPGLIIGFTVHEYCHAAAAVALGDSTPRLEGRLTLNPAAHIDWLGLLLFVLLGWGYARPVNVRIGNLRGRKWGEAAVSLAGPSSNFVLAAVCYALWKILPDGLWTAFLFYACSINLTLCFLNLLPVPPLDGFALLRLILPLRMSKFVFFMQRYGILILVALSFLGALDWYFGIAKGLSYLLFGLLPG